MQELRPRRIVGIDIARSLAIFCAMSAHVMALAGIIADGLVGEAALLFMRSATPLFIVLFGTMLEIVYAPRFAAGQRFRVTGRLLSRAIQCALLYQLSVLVLFLVHPDYSARYSAATILFMGNTPYTDILKFYAVALFLAPLLLLLRVRRGLWPLVIGSVALHLAWPLLRGLPAPTEPGWPLGIARFLNLFLQFGEPDLAGPSALQGLTLTVAGMVLGRYLLHSGDGARLRRRSWRLAGCAGLLLGLGLALGGRPLVLGILDMSLRFEAHPVYFLKGLLAAVTITGTAIALTCTLPAARQRMLGRWAFLGRTSLFTFAWGNMVLYLFLGSEMLHEHQALGFAALLALVLLLSLAADRVIHRHEVIVAPLRRLESLIGGLARGLAAVLMSLADRRRRQRLIMMRWAVQRR